jgi:hypothetical protein
LDFAIQYLSDMDTLYSITSVLNEKTMTYDHLFKYEDHYADYQCSRPYHIVPNEEMHIYSIMFSLADESDIGFAFAIPMSPN